MCSRVERSRRSRTAARCRRSISPVSETTFLDVRGLCVSYGRSQVLFDVSLAAHRRGAVAVLGRNGAGKTTLLRAIVGELEARPVSIPLGALAIMRMPTERPIRMCLG